MTSLFGAGETSYSAIRDYHGDLNVGGAGNSEYVFLSGYNTNKDGDKPLRDWAWWTDYALFNNKSISPIKREDKPKILRDIDRIDGQTLYDIISRLPNVSKFKKLIDDCKYGKVYDGPITLFVPIDDKFDDVLQYQLKMSHSLELMRVLRYHILPFSLTPWQMKGRRLRLTTDLNNNLGNGATLDVDCTKPSPVLLNPINTYFDTRYGQEHTNPFRLSGDIRNPSYEGSGSDPIPSRGDAWFPKKDWEVKILASYEGLNGMIYVVDRPLVPSDSM